MNVQLDQLTGIPSSPGQWTFNPIALLIAAIVVVVYYMFFSSVGAAGDTGGQTGGVALLEMILWGVFLGLVILNGMLYVFDIDVSASVKNLLGGTPEVDVVVDAEDSAPVAGASSTVPEITYEKQVFHVPNNEYDYEDAKALCRAYGGRLATYKEIEAAYENGGSWCGYGWSDGQMALYPTQYEQWERLQNVKGHEHDCGRPGVNGGYIANPNVRFGANCYGYKPKITPEEARLMEEAPLYPKTRKEINFERRIDHWRNKLPSILVAPFNHDNWSAV